MYWKKDLAGHFVKYLLVLKKAYFLVLARKAGIRNPNYNASQYKVILVLVNYFFTYFQKKISSKESKWKLASAYYHSNPTSTGKHPPLTMAGDLYFQPHNQIGPLLLPNHYNVCNEIQIHERINRNNKKRKEQSTETTRNSRSLKKMAEIK